MKLSAGEHKFEYYHAAAGRDAVMVAAWEIDPPDDKPQASDGDSRRGVPHAPGRPPAGEPG